MISLTLEQLKKRFLLLSNVSWHHVITLFALSCLKNNNKLHLATIKSGTSAPFMGD